MRWRNARHTIVVPALVLALLSACGRDGALVESADAKPKATTTTSTTSDVTTTTGPATTTSEYVTTTTERRKQPKPTTTSTAPTTSSTTSTTAPAPGEGVVTIAQSTDPVNGNPGLQMYYSWPTSLQNRGTAKVELFEDDRSVGYIPYTRGWEPPVPAFFQALEVDTMHRYHAVGTLEKSGVEVPGSRTTSETLTLPLSVSAFNQKYG